jgi:hypothetical protein
MEANIRVGRIDVALPVNDHLGSISGVGDGIDASSRLCQSKFSGCPGCVSLGA